jgi:phage terminase small subunit
MSTLTTKQATFIDAVISGQTPTAAARLAGFQPQDQARQIGYRLMRTPTVINAIRERQRAMISEMVPRSLRVLDTIIADEATPPGVRVRGVQLVLQAAEFLNARGQATNDGSEKPLSEMSLVELERVATEQRDRVTSALRAVEDLQRECAAQAATITIEPQARIEHQAADLEDDHAVDPDPWD